MRTIDVSYLNRLKDEQNLTLQQIADQSNVPIGTVKRLFAGSTDSPGIGTLADIVEVINGSLDDLMGMNVETHVKIADNRQTIEYVLAESRASFHLSYDHLKNATERCLDEKNQWLKYMFTYCCVLTVAVVAMAVMVGVVR